MVDTLDIYTKLKATGLTSKQSKTIAKVIFRVHSARLADLAGEMDRAARTDFQFKDGESTKRQSSGR